MKQSYFDIVDEDDELTGRIASYDEVHQGGLWHRGVHAIIHTADGRIVMQKRSHSLNYHPGEIEVSVGGGVDAGESPAQAIVREVREELGLNIRESDLRYIGKTKFNHRNGRRFMRTFIYSYAVCVSDRQLQHMRVNEDENSMVFLTSERRLRRALRLHRMGRLGRISSTYAYWRYLIDAI